mgnify:CR=1 FL=1
MGTLGFVLEPKNFTCHRIWQKSPMCMEEHSQRLGGAATDQDRYRKVRAFLKPLLERQSVRSAVEPLVVEAAEKKQDTFHDWLSAEPSRDRVRDISKCNRLQSGVAKWPMEWLDQAGVVCFERGKVG